MRNFLIGLEARIFPAPSIDAIEPTLLMLVVSLFTTANCFQAIRDEAQNPLTIPSITGWLAEIHEHRITQKPLGQYGVTLAEAAGRSAHSLSASKYSHNT